MGNNNEGTTPALSDEQVRRLLETPPEGTLKGARDRAILATLLYHGMRREELCNSESKGSAEPRGVIHFKVKGKARENSLCAGACIDDWPR